MTLLNSTPLNMHIKLIAAVCIIVWFACTPALAQQTDSTKTVSDELQFIDYLINNREFDDALVLLRQPELLTKANAEQTDSIHYLLGWTFYNMKQLDSSIVYFKRINQSSPVYVKASYYKAFELLYSGRYEEAEQAISVLPAQDSLQQELRLFQQSIGYLLQKKYTLFDSAAAQFTYTNFACATEQKNLFTYRDELKKVKQRSPVLAGVFSAVLPGSGKLYAGYKGQAIATLMPCVVFGAVAVENYIKDGPKDAKFIAAASVFSIFYVGNIWGSVMSVKTIRTQRNNEIYNSILLDLHIPLRRIFN